MDDAEAAKWLHVYSQFMYHDDANIRATRAGLLELRAAIDRALEKGAGYAEVMTSDGEGFTLNVQCVNTIAGLGEPEYLYRLEYSMGERSAERRRKNSPRIDRNKEAGR